MVHRLLASATALLILTDVAYGVQNLTGNLQWQHWISFAYTVCHLLAGLAAVRHASGIPCRTGRQSIRIPAARPETVSLYLAYGALAMAWVVLMAGTREAVTLPGALVILAMITLVLARQMSGLRENVRLYEGLRKAHEELERKVEDRTRELQEAYDVTLQGWSHALELRDKETQGHTLRVGEATVHLARAMELPERKIFHMRRGAFLHDIGKMAIPDEILLKPGPLTEEEWVIMRRHPVYAYELLHPIAYLGPAIEIPYCHHEKWDGSGYPRGLKGEEIPLAARVFSVVDVWDALSRDRPYRAAWPPDTVRSYLVEESGKSFEPRIVEAFLALLDEGKVGV